EFPAIRIAVDQLDVIENITTILDVIRATHADNKFGCLSKHPVCDIQLVRAEFSHQTTRELTILSPVFLLVGQPFWDRLVPWIPKEGVPVPLPTNVGDFPQHSFVDHLADSLVEVTV